MKLTALFAAMAVSLTLGVSVGVADSKDSPRIQHVFFAQHHVQAPTEELFKLVGKVDAVVVVRVSGKEGSPSPAARVILRSGDKTLQLPLKGPANLPATADENPKRVQHGYEDSFTATIPKEWVAPGLDVSVAIGGEGDRTLDAKDLGPIPVGAPTQMTLTMFDIHYFGLGKEDDYAPGWLDGLTARLPVSQLELRRVRGIMFDSLVQMPRNDGPAIRSSSPEEYQRMSGLKFDGEQGIALRWIRALKGAAGADKTKRPYFISIYGVPAGGQGWGFSAVGSGTNHGVLLHENGHALGSLPDLWGKGLSKYPYVGPMKDYPAPGDAENIPHVGPTWAFDPFTRQFISPVHDGAHRRDPMGGGGVNRDGGPGGMYRFFSDYHFSLVRKQLEESQLRFDKQTGEYRAWDQTSGAYTRVAGKLGVDGFPIEEDVEVVSLLFTASLVTPEANIAYPPIGPYVASRIRCFEASPQGIAEAKEAGFSDESCHFSVRVTQGGKVTTYLAKDSLNPTLPAKDPSSMSIFALNLPARDGVITKIELLETPKVISEGLAKDPKVVDAWSGEYATAYVQALSPAVDAAKPNDAR